MQAARWANVFVIAAVLGTAQSASASSSAAVSVHVSYDRTALPGVLCRLRNALFHDQRIADREGNLKFDGVSAGKYRVECTLQGYRSAQSDVAVRDDDVEIHVDVRLQLQQIGRVQSRGSAASTSRILTRAAPLGKLSQNLYEMVNSIGGANVITDASGSLVGISLEGRDPRMTQYGFDGTRIPEPGALRALDADLLQSAQVDDAKSEADFYTLAPTTYPEYTVRQMFGGFGAASTQAGVRGSAGAVGYVVQGKFRAQRSALDGAVYQDTSGLTYRHAGTFGGDGLLAKLSAPVNNNFTLTVETLVRQSTTSPIDAFYDGPVPSGSGPGNSVTASSALTKAQLEGELGRWQVKLNATSIRTRQTFDYRNRVVALQRLPFQDDERLSLDILDASLIDFIASGKTLNISLASSRGAAVRQSTDFGFGGSYASRQTRSLPDDHVQLLYVARPNKFAQESIGVTAESRGAGRSATFVEGNASVGANGRRVFGTLGSGGRVVSASELQPLDDPAAARYDCEGNAIRARAPNDIATNVRERHLRLGGLFEGARANVSVQAFDTLDAGATVTGADTPLSSFSLQQLPSQFAAQLLSGFGTFGQCAPQRFPPAIYLVRDVSGLLVEYRGVEVAASTKIKQALTLQGALNLHQAILRSQSSALLAPDSPYVAGEQLPSVEPFDASLTADYGLHDGRTELIANAVYKPRNNTNGLPAYWLVTLGGTRKISATSSATLVATNALHQYVGTFSSLQYAVPLRTVSGGGLLLPASPLIQPQLFLTLDFKLAREP
jgi:hypothetical protein